MDRLTKRDENRLDIIGLDKSLIINHLDPFELGALNNAIDKLADFEDFCEKKFGQSFFATREETKAKLKWGQKEIFIIEELIMGIEKQLEIYTRALYLAVEQLTDAKEMLRSVEAKDLANVLDDSADYFLIKARYEIEKEMRAKNDN